MDIQRIIKHIAAFRNHPSVKILDVLYGPRSLPLRTQVAAMMLDRKVTGSDKAAQYGNLRTALLNALEITGTCKADEDSRFEVSAEALLREPSPVCSDDPGTGEIYHCNSLDCPVHGQRNIQENTPK